MSIKTRLNELERRVMPSDPLDVCGVDLVIRGKPWGTGLLSGPRSQLPTAEVLEYKTVGAFVTEYQERGCNVRLVGGINA